MTDNKTTNMVIRMTAELKDAATQQAKKDNRTLSSYVINLIKTDIEKSNK